MRILLATQQLFHWSGSEAVTLELAEALTGLGHEVAMFSPLGAPHFLSPLLPDLGLMWYRSNPANVPLSEFDVVYSHHQTATTLLAAQPDTFWQEGLRPVFVYNHLSSFEAMEFPGPFVQRALADIILANSPETARRLKDFGPDFASATVFPNPAPASFAWVRPRTGSPALRRLLSVSNHLPGPLRAAFELLKGQGVEIVRIGRPQHERRVTPQDLAGADAVVANGKTVQYALRAQCPVFCYDSFGGPGWLTEQNVAAAADRNFSGRCSDKRATPEDLAYEISNGFPTVAASPLPADDFMLETHLARLLKRIGVLLQKGRPRLPDDLQFRRNCQHEAAIYGLVTRERSQRPMVQAWKNPAAFRAQMKHYGGLSA